MCDSRPYKVIQTGSDFELRYFWPEDQVTFKWHQDAENRLILAQHSHDWQLQLDNCLPQPIPLVGQLGQAEIPGIYVPQLKFHRLIPGTEPVVLVIKKLTN